MIEPSIDREIGKLEEHAKATEIRLASIERQLLEVLLTLQQARGGWRMLMIVGGSCAAVGAFVTGLWSTVTGRN